jgi:Flp pilus assembly protein TadD
LALAILALTVGGWSQVSAAPQQIAQHPLQATAGNRPGPGPAPEIGPRIGPRIETRIETRITTTSATATGTEPLPEREVQLQLGKRYFAENNLAAAMACFRRVNQLAPDNLHVHFWLGLVLDQTGDTPGALKEYQQSLELAQSIKMDCAELRINRGNALTKLTQTQPPLNKAADAILEYKRGIVIDPGNALAFLGLAKCLVDSGDYDGALNSLQKFGSLGGRDNSVPLIRGLALAGKGNFSDARIDLHNFIDLNQSTTSDANQPTKAVTNPALLDLARKVLNEIELIQ